MPSRKQRRRRTKLRRHEYEYVYVDDEGREVEVDPAELKPEREEAPRRRAQQTRSGRAIEPPSWRRVLRRGLIFAPLMYLMLLFLEPDLSLLGRLAYTAWLMTIFIPFSYLMDRTVYRRYLKRTGAREADAR
jgi:hypothetical protein